MAARTHQPVGKRAVICHDQKAFRILIQSAAEDQMLSFRFREIIKHCPAGVFRCTDTARRLVEHIIDIAFLPDLPALVTDAVLLCHLKARIGYGQIIDQHLFFPDVIFHFTSCTDTGVCQPFIQSHLFHPAA